MRPFDIRRSAASNDFFGNVIVDIFAHGLEYSVDVKICISQNGDIVTLQCFRSLFVVSDLFRFIVLRTIDLYRNHRLGTEKIDDVTLYHILPMKANGIVAKKIIPQMVLLLRCVVT